MGRLTYQDRLRIRELTSMRLSAPEIARDIGCSDQAVYNEWMRGGGKDAYDPDLAQRQIEQNRPRRGKITRDDRIFLVDRDAADLVSRMILEEGLNVKQVCEWLHREGPGGFHRLPNSPNTIWKAIDDGLIPGVSRETFRRRTVVVAAGNTIHLPAWVISSLDLKHGDTLTIQVTGDKVVLQRDSPAAPKKR